MNGHDHNLFRCGMHVAPVAARLPDKGLSVLLQSDTERPARDTFHGSGSQTQSCDSHCSFEFCALSSRLDPTPGSFLQVRQDFVQGFSLGVAAGQ
jgi:hypothetical protein